MGFKMGFTKGELSPQPVPEGWYYLLFTGFKPAKVKDKDSINLKPEFEVVQHPEFTGRKIWPLMTSRMGFVIFDCVHSFGLQMEEEDNEYKGTDAATLVIPGTWEFMEQFPEEPEKWGKYLGPLTNGVIFAEVAIIPDQQGKPRNDIRQYKCAIPECNERHNTNLLKGRN